MKQTIPNHKILATIHTIFWVNFGAITLVDILKKVADIHGVSKDDISLISTNIIRQLVDQELIIPFVNKPDKTLLFKRNYKNVADLVSPITSEVMDDAGDFVI
jgi:hypothetical protein